MSGPDDRVRRLADLPVLRVLFETGAPGLMFDLLILTGPVLVALLALLGRSLVTEALALAYLGTFVGYVGYQWWAGPPTRR